ncbi:hypothetical protein SAMN05428970_2389 [Agromyces sp. CF514]|nr:hypothetical protein SAMN05428970_2389 [Agromyces sp. CF514]
MDQVVTELSGNYNRQSGHDISINVANYSPMALLSVYLIGPDLDARVRLKDAEEDWSEAMLYIQAVPDPLREIEHKSGFHVLQPGNSARQEIYQKHYSDLTDFYIELLDGRGRRWVRGALSREYVSARKARKVVKHARDNAT